MHLLSILLITYNNEDYIEETLKSIVKQKTNFSFEIVVGDDNSTDTTLSIIKQFENQYPNVFNIKKNQQRLGILKNFKTTLDRCKGTYIFDIAGDDLLKTTDALQKMVDGFTNNSAIGFIDSGYDSYFMQSKKIEKFSNQKLIIASKEEYIKSIKLGKIYPVGVCYNRESLYKYVDFETYLQKNITIEDYPILVDLIMHTKFKRIPEVLHTYRIHTKSYSNKKAYQHVVFLKEQMLDLFLYFKTKYNFSEELAKQYKTAYTKNRLFEASSYKQEKDAIHYFNAIENKSIKDYLLVLFAKISNPFITKLIRKLYRAL